MNRIKHAIVGACTGGTLGIFFDWLFSGWQYLKGHVPFDIWDSTIVSAIPEG